MRDRASLVGQPHLEAQTHPQVMSILHRSAGPPQAWLAKAIDGDGGVAGAMRKLVGIRVEREAGGVMCDLIAQTRAYRQTAAHPRETRPRALRD